MTSTRKIIEIKDLSKVYPDGFHALKSVNLDIQKGEIFALLGPNGAGKTTLINMICGIVNVHQGQINIDNYNVVDDFRVTRGMVGLVPQELTSESFETVLGTVGFSRGLFGKKKNDQYIERILKSLSLWDKRDSSILKLSGGMKRRVLIAKALAHEPKIIFLDEPTAGVDVELRQDMWEVVKQLRNDGVTIILTTHYIEEAQQIADRIGIIDHGELILVKEKENLMRELGKKHIKISLEEPLVEIPHELKCFDLIIEGNMKNIVFSYDSSDKYGISSLLTIMSSLDIRFFDVETKESSLEEIFVNLVKRKSD